MWLILEGKQRDDEFRKTVWYMFFEKKLDIIFSSNSDFKKGGVYIQSEVSQKEKNKYCILMHIYGIKKMVW